MKQTRQLTILLLLVLACIGRVAGQGKVYWLKNNAGTISRANIDGTTTETLVTGALCADGAFISSSLGKVMWVEGCGKMALKIADLDGTNVQILDTFNTTGRQISPRGVTFDEATGIIYVIGQSGYARGNISSLPLTATETSTITGRGIAVNSGTGKLYFTTQNDNKVRVCNTDGTGVDTIRTNLANAWGVQVDADNGKVYFADGLGIYKTNLDGTGFQTVYTFPASLTFTSIAIDVRNDRLFWASNGGVINKATLGGLNPTQIITGQGGIFAITIGASSSRQASNINFNTITANSTNAIFKKGNGAGRVAFLKADTLSVPVPVDGTTYTGNAAFGSGTQIGTSGWFCVYSGTDSTVSITGLAANTTYRMMVMEYSGTGSNIDYNVTYANLNPNKFRTGGVSITPPTVLTVGAASIASTSAVLRGNVTASGGASVTERGVVYSTTANPTIATATKRAIGFNTGTFGTNITGFTPSTLYYFRAYAINSAGTAYGSDSTFTTLGLPPVGPRVSTAKATLIGTTNATLGGNVSDSGTATVTERGIVYATTINPTTGNTKVQIGTGVGTFSQNITGLTPSTLYHVRAYAINSAGTGYGADSTFTTAAGTPSTVLAGDTSLKSIPMGIPVVVDNSLTISGASTIQGANVTIVSGLLSGDTLSYASTLPAGVTASYNALNGVLQFNGNATAAEYQTLLRSVTLKTNAVTSTSARRVSFTLGNAVPYNGHFYEFVSTPGSFTASKSAASARSYFGLQGYLVTIADSFENNYVYQKISADAWMGASDEFSEINTATGTSTFANQTAAEGNWYWVTGPEKGTKFATGNFPSTVQPGKYMNWSNFEPNNAGGEHYAQFFSTNVGKWNDLDNSNNIGYVCEYGGMPGDPTLVLSYARNIKPVLINPVTVITASPTLVATTSATLGGNAIADGGANITERGVVYATTVDPTTANTKVVIGAGLGTFSQNITGLTSATLYHVRAYAINSVGTSYGADSTFTTLIATSVPQVITGTATAISTTSATLAGNVVSNGNATVTERGIVLATTANPTTANTKITIGNGLGNFAQNVTALTPNTVYHYRAYAINSIGTGYGVDSVFTTLPNAEFNKNITNAFSPDGDGFNDTWIIDNAELLNDHKITIYNIFGQVVFNQTGYNTPWDGKKDGDLVPSGEYYYQIKGDKVNIKGALLIKTHQ